MFLISHRGNISGAKPLLENYPVYISLALRAGFDCEVDVWNINGNYLLGHDSPDFFVKESFLENDKLWCHAKNLQALSSMIRNSKIHCFWHQEDDYTITSRNYIWAYPGKPVVPNCISVLPKNYNIKNLSVCSGICSDNILSYKDIDELSFNACK
jgi:hypothetical protein